MILLLFRAIRHFRSIFKTINKADINNQGPAKLIRASQFQASFSFFNYVFINPSVSEKETAEIMNHEIVHVRQKHWFDLLLVEILRLIQWVNPFAWIYTRFIRLNHEYLADQAALQRSASPANYRAALMNQLFNSTVISLSNSFNYSLNKKRFDMMKKIITSPYRKLKVLLVLPIFAIVFYAFATPEYHYTTQPVNQNSETTFASVEMPSPIMAVKEVKGIVLKEDGSPFSGVQILVAGTKIRTVTDASGSFTLTNVPESTFIVFSYRGYLTQSLKPDFSKAMNIKLLQDPDYNKAFTVQENELPKVPYSNFTTINSFNNTAGALIVINGVPSDRETMKSINPDNIESVNVLKNESATAQYGEKGKNGVILITTKNGAVVKEKKEPAVIFAPTTQQGRPNKAIFVDGVFTDKPFPQINKDLGHDWGIVKPFSEKEGLEKYGEQGKNGGYDIITRKKAIEMGLKPQYPRIDPEDYPTFQGQGHASFNDWLIRQIKYPDDAVARGVSGKVTASYNINSDGTLSSPAILYSADQSLGDAVVKAIASSPQWEPPKNPESTDPFKTMVTIKFELPDKIYIPEEPFVVVEEMPMFPGGDVALLKFIAENTQYPLLAKTNGITGRVIIRFVVDKDGQVQEATVLRGVDPLLDAEAVRVVSSLPAFSPGKQGGKPVPVYYMVPITFSLTKPDSVKTNP
jgi:TonB family protein